MCGKKIATGVSYFAGIVKLEITINKIAIGRVSTINGLQINPKCIYKLSVIELPNCRLENDGKVRNQMG